MQCPRAHCRPQPARAPAHRVTATPPTPRRGQREREAWGSKGALSGLGFGSVDCTSRWALGKPPGNNARLERKRPPLTQQKAEAGEEGEDKERRRRGDTGQDLTALGTAFFSTRSQSTHVFAYFKTTPFHPLSKAAVLRLKGQTHQR